MTMLYKLTNQDGQTHGSTQWGEGVTHTASGEGELCGPGWLHAYTSPLLAVLLNPIHANISNPRLWECEGEIGATDGLKVDCLSLTTLREIPVPTLTVEQRVRFGVICARQVYREAGWRAWAEAWLSGADRSGKAAYASWAAAGASRASRAAAYAARAAVGAADDSWAAGVGAAMAAVYAVKAAKAAAGVELDLVALAEEAVAGSRGESALSESMS